MVIANDLNLQIIDYIRIVTEHFFAMLWEPEYPSSPVSWVNLGQDMAGSDLWVRPHMVPEDEFRGTLGTLPGTGQVQQGDWIFQVFCPRKFGPGRPLKAGGHIRGWFSDLNLELQPDDPILFVDPKIRNIGVQQIKGKVSPWYQVNVDCPWEHRSLLPMGQFGQGTFSGGILQFQGLVGPAGADGADGVAYANIERYEAPDPGEVPDGARKNFSTARTYDSGTLEVWELVTKLIPGVDYTEDGDRQGFTITAGHVAPETDTLLHWRYFYQ